MTNFPNLAGKPNIDSQLKKELKNAGIGVHHMPVVTKGEVQTHVIGVLHQWDFQRAWRYWIAKGPGIPIEYAEVLYETHGYQARCSGDCACRSPRHWYGNFGVGMYHVDTCEGLIALADTIEQVATKD